MGYELSELNDISDIKQNTITFLEKNGIIYDTSGKKPVVSLRIWGSGTPMREFLWSDDMADACVYIMENLSFDQIKTDSINKEVRNTHINIGSGKEISIKELAYMIKDIVGYKGEVVFDTTKPDGTLRKLLDVSKLNNLGWYPRMGLSDGIKELYRFYSR